MEEQTNNIEEMIAVAQDFLTTQGLDFAIGLITAIAIFVFGKMVAKGLTKLFRKALSKGKTDETLVSFLGNIAYGLLMAMVVIASLGQLGVQTASLVAVIGAAGLAVGLALQGSLANFAAGVMIIAFRPFKKGDFIEAAGVSGVVNELSIFTTTLKTGDNKTVIIPNGAVGSGTITNYSAEKQRRVDMTFGIGYDDDIKKAKDVILKVLEKDDRVLKDPAPLVAVSELADSSVNFTVRPWVKSADYWGVFFDTHEAIKIAFDKAGLSIPYPQQDVHMHNVVELEGKKAA